MEAAEHIPKNLQNAVAKLEDAIGKANVNTSKMERLLYSHDLAPLPNIVQVAFKNVPDVVVRPTSTEDLQKIVKIAIEEEIPITPRGGSTWGLAGSVPVFAGILIDFTGAMNNILKIDEVNLTVTAQAGCTWKKVYDACLEKGLLLGSYPSSAPSATLGGWISTGGSGFGSYKYGAAADNIRSMEVVMPDGTIVNTGFEKVIDNMTGYNLNRLICGAEGTLALISNVTFKLVPAEVIRPLTYFFKDLPSLGKPLFEIAHKRVAPMSISFANEEHFEMLKKIGRHVTEVTSALNIVLEGDKETVVHEESIIDAIAAKYGGRKADDATAQHEFDERSYEHRCNMVGLSSIPAEVVIPVKDFETFAIKCHEMMHDMKLTGAIIGNMADRNTVVFMPYYVFDPSDMLQMTVYGFNKKLGDYSFEFGGRPLTGFGAFFASSLDQLRGTGAKYIREIKKTIDPQDIMNPGKLTGTTLRYGITIPPALFDVGMKGMAVAKLALPRNTQFDDKAEAFANERMIKERAEKEHQHPKN
jgi:glycolate oxidase